MLVGGVGTIETHATGPSALGIRHNARQMNSSLRLLIVASAMVAVLALVAGLAAENDRVRERQRAATTTTAARPAVAPGRTIEAKVPSAKPIEVRAGDTVKLTVTLKKDDSVIIDALGFTETFAAGLPTEVIITPAAPGNYDLKLQNGGGRIGRLVVKPARPAAEAPPAERERPMTPAVTDTNAA